MMIQFFLALTLAAGSPTIDKSPPYWENNGWRVYSYPKEQMCDLTVRNNYNHDMTIGYSAKRNAIMFYVSNETATSLSDGQTVFMNVYLFTEEAEDFDATWNNVEFKANRVISKGAFLITYDLPLSLLEEMRKSETLAVFAQTNKPVAAFPLANVGPAISVLRQCAYDAADLNPKDPFLE